MGPSRVRCRRTRWFCDSCTVGAGPGERIFFVTASEAVIAIEEVEEAPIDAAIVGIIENFTLSPGEL